MPQTVAWFLFLKNKIAPLLARCAPVFNRVYFHWVDTSPKRIRKKTIWPSKERKSFCPYHSYWLFGFRNPILLKNLDSWSSFNSNFVFFSIVKFIKPLEFVGKQNAKRFKRRLGKVWLTGLLIDGCKVSVEVIQCWYIRFSTAQLNIWYSRFDFLLWSCGFFDRKN